MRKKKIRNRTRRSGERTKERSVTEREKTRWEKARKSGVETKSGNKREEITE